MNTAVRVLNQRALTRQPATRLFSLKLSAQLIILAIAVLVSAFTLIYVKDLNRRLFIEYQNLQEQQNQLHIEWGKLLLEQSTWSTQSRVQAIAEKKLNMEVPQTNEVVLISH